MKSYVLGSVVLAAFAVAVMHLSAASGATPAPASTTAPKGSEQLVLAGGCFWGMEAVFEQLKGVSSVVAGYSGGSADTAHYEIVSTGETGHAESVRITFDPSQISLDQLFDVFFTIAHDPTELDRQGPDDGSQYRSVIFYADDAQKSAAEAYVKHLEAAKAFSAPIVTQIVQFRAFYPAEAYHQHFVQNHPDYPYVVFNALPKLKHLREQFPQLVKQ